ncbi:MAG: DivIVA domain-containing protein [Nigerium sp.]|nr:DivIVA domain-containing protein [Nigerium sp.]
MVWFLGACAVAVLGLAAVVGSGRFGSLPPPVHDTPVLDLPPGALTGADLRAIRFAGGGRGYACAQVDEVLARLAAQLDAAASPPDDPAVVAEPAADAVGAAGGEGLR